MVGGPQKKHRALAGRFGRWWRKGIRDVVVSFAYRQDNVWSRYDDVASCLSELTQLRDQLKAGYLANAERDLQLAAEWFPLEEEAYGTIEKHQTPKSTTKPKRK